jgi:hypothetical protein
MSGPCFTYKRFINVIETFETLRKLHHKHRKKNYQVLLPSHVKKCKQRRHIFVYKFAWNGSSLPPFSQLIQVGLLLPTQREHRIREREDREVLYSDYVSWQS